MAEKRETIEDVARREAEVERERAQARADQQRMSAELAKQMPDSFFELAGLLRENVRRFNSAADPSKRLVWRESPALAARDANLHADFNLTFGRAGAEVTVALNAMGRSGKPDVFIIEGSGQLLEDRFLLRVEGFVQKGQIALRITVDFKRIECTLEELAERLVFAAIKCDYTQLYRAN